MIDLYPLNSPWMEDEKEDDEEKISVISGNRHVRIIFMASTKISN